MEIFGFTLTASDTYFLSAVGALLMALLYPRINDWQHRRGRLRDAVHAYKLAFSDGISALANRSIGLDTFGNDFEAHQAAVDAIRPILPKRYQRKLQKAWDEYRGKGDYGGFNSKEYVEMSGSFLWLGNSEIHKQMGGAFKKRFNRLYGCLDGLL